MVDSSNFRESLANSNFYDLKFEYRNFAYEDLLNKAVGQAIYIEKLEKAHIEHVDEIEKLKFQNKRLEHTLLVINN